MKLEVPYRLAIFDMDGTLLGPDGQVSGENVHALQRLRDAGVQVAIASGRHHSNIVAFERHLGFQGWVISAGGAVVRHAGTQELIYEVTVPQDLAMDLFHRGRALDVSLIGYHDSGIFCDRQSEWTHLYTKRTGQVPVADIPDLISSGLQKLIWTREAETIERLTVEMSREYEGRLYVVSTEHEMLEFLNIRANKSHAAQVLARKLGFGQEQVVAFGDGNNDVPILQWAGLSIAMDHGRETAKRAAKKISPPGPPETAVARGIDLILGPG
jgi:Cof subfamily protein (haloacid dehalogenase superfamily)